MARFTGKVVVVTGAASSIGEAVARRFATEGAALVLNDKNAGGLRELVTNLKDTTVETQSAASPRWPTARRWRSSLRIGSVASTCS